MGKLTVRFIFVFVACFLPLTACGAGIGGAADGENVPSAGDSKNPSYDVDITDSSAPVRNMSEALTWKNVNDRISNSNFAYTACFGKTLHELLDSGAIYLWFYPDGQMKVLADGVVPDFLLFSDMPLADGSVFTAVCFPFDYFCVNDAVWDGGPAVSKDRIVESGAVEWIDEPFPRYEYKLNDGILQIRTNEDGSAVLMDAYALLKSVSAPDGMFGIAPDTDKPVRIPAEARQSDKWETFNPYAERVGKTESELLPLLTEHAYRDSGSTIYDPADGVQYLLAGGICKEIAIPEKLCFPDGGGLETMRKFETPFKYDGVFKQYQFWFEDHMYISVDADENMSLLPDGSIRIGVL
jgi:hypothetical protein